MRQGDSQFLICSIKALLYSGLGTRLRRSQPCAELPNRSRNLSLLLVPKFAGLSLIRLSFQWYHHHPSRCKASRVACVKTCIWEYSGRDVYSCYKAFMQKITCMNCEGPEPSFARNDLKNGSTYLSWYSALCPRMFWPHDPSSELGFWVCLIPHDGI